MLCHSVFSWRSPVPLSFQESSVAIENRQNGVPLAVYFSSGSFPSRPTRITLFTDFAICSLLLSPCRGRSFSRSRCNLLKLGSCRSGFSRIRKLRLNLLQDRDCLLRLVEIGEGVAFLQKGG